MIKKQTVIVCDICGKEKIIISPKPKVNLYSSYSTTPKIKIPLPFYQLKQGTKKAELICSEECLRKIFVKYEEEIIAKYKGLILDSLKK